VSPAAVFEKALIPFRLVFIMWLVFVIQVINGYNLTFLGIRPRSLEGLPGVLTAPMVHADIPHLVGNTMPVLFLGAVLFYFYARVAHRTFFVCYLLTNALVWLLAPSVTYHVGASGLVYALASFLILYGFFRRQIISLFISLVVLVVYGGIFYGVLPLRPDISWESHLAGALVGIGTAIYFRRK
jgi:membrane associated rhomboid family serine protease